MIPIPVILFKCDMISISTARRKTARCTTPHTNVVSSQAVENAMKESDYIFI